MCCFVQTRTCKNSRSSVKPSSHRFTEETDTSGFCLSDCKSPPKFTQFCVFRQRTAAQCICHGICSCTGVVGVFFVTLHCRNIWYLKWRVTKLPFSGMQITREQYFFAPVTLTLTRWPLYTNLTWLLRRHTENELLRQLFQKSEQYRQRDRETDRHTDRQLDVSENIITSLSERGSRTTKYRKIVSGRNCVGFVIWYGWTTSEYHCTGRFRGFQEGSSSWPAKDKLEWRSQAWNVSTKNGTHLERGGSSR